MYIDTKSVNCMERCVSDFLNMTAKELYINLDNISKKCVINQWNFDSEKFEKLSKIMINKSVNAELDEILFFHLSRRLIGTEQDVKGYNLKELLTTSNAMSEFLNAHRIKFVEGDQHIETFFRGKKVDWNCCLKGNSEYIKLRLGYYKGREDYCINT